ncbi:hypothetical protein JFT91_08360 [Pseudomonas sp. TH08]|uniref:hypothetical protein n=1 Tax=unclassified Pseudomonas TaxID=196821 RepID=UPI001911469E|nr:MULTISPECIES: hypothetical protein [unclassified Pseudomonas]MBK5526115.1 hypothetical protein [Pseudomonas sp. TH06]MBK5532622.1 hypothetical protein [Pseudomonas sp. TH08]
MSEHVLEDRSIKLSGLVTLDYCVLASISQIPARSGTVWTNKDSSESIVISKNHHRTSDEESQITLTTSPANGAPTVTTTAAGMFEIICAEDRYETSNRVAYKEHARISSNQWRSVVYGGADLSDEMSVTNIDPYVNLTEDQFLLSARINDYVIDPQAVRVTAKRYTRRGDRYQVTVIVPNNSYGSVTDFSQNDMFRTLAIGDSYAVDQTMRIVKEKRVFYLETIGGIEFYGREILLA